MFNPLISIITPSFNSEEFIRENILSVFQQSYKNIEHIIVDGNSTDKTVEIIKEYKHISWISEKDAGQSDAYNKGIAMSKGELLLFLNSDDFLINRFVVENIVKLLDETLMQKYSAFMCKLDIVNAAGEKINLVTNYNKDYDFDTLLNKYPVVIHPSTYFVRESVIKAGGYSMDYHYNMDYEFFLKVSKDKPIHSLNIVSSALRQHGMSKGCGENNWKFSLEFMRIRKEFGGHLFSKLSLQPIKEMVYHYVGKKNIEKLKKNKIAQKIAQIIGVKRINRLIWYGIKEEKK